MSHKVPFFIRTSFLTEILNEQKHVEVDEQQILTVCNTIITDAGYQTGRLGVFLTDNATIREINIRHLGHDYATDVVSFVLEQSENHLEGELAISAETAQERAAEFGWNEKSELLLYAIHGTLHLVGYDDQTPNDSRVMRQKESDYLATLGIKQSKISTF
ncbi:MAG: rRNA maturation RNase YbeY [Planctomycetaceae bacterium]|jgi:probable rRNA maturation factor|nr:rRNA maturation RNase YbeY [Planctomycetaceae bacterium]